VTSDSTSPGSTAGRGAGELRFSRVFAAPRPLVFRCMVDPDHLAHFWGPKGTRTPRSRIVVDARPGGVFETIMVNETDGSEYETRAVYEVVREPELLVWTESHSGMRVRSEFIELGPQRTEVRIHQTYVPEAFLAHEAQAGFLSSLDRFDAYLVALGTPTNESAAADKEEP
jgi:uncharacterized protein YndB with AHSA1/START domain